MGLQTRGLVKELGPTHGSSGEQALDGIDDGDTGLDRDGLLLVLWG